MPKLIIDGYKGRCYAPSFSPPDNSDFTEVTIATSGSSEPDYLIIQLPTWLTKAIRQAVYEAQTKAKFELKKEIKSLLSL